MEDIETYDADFVAELIRDFDIPPDKAVRLGLAINAAAAQWHRYSGHDGPWDVADHKAFGEIYDQLAAARDALRRLDYNALRQLKEIQDYISDRDDFPQVESRWEGPDERDFVIRPDHPLDPTRRPPFDPGILAEMISATLQVVEFGTITSVPKRGPKTDRRLGYWMWTIRSTWRAATRQSFTRDFTTANEPLSPAARFCVKLYAALSPETPASRINSTMKRVIAAERDT